MTGVYIAADPALFPATSEVAAAAAIVEVDAAWEPESEELELVH